MATAQPAKPGVIAVVFADAREARAARRAVRSLMHTHALCVEDMAIAARALDGAVSIHVRRNFLLAGVTGGVAWGVVLGGFLFQPLLGLVTGLIGGVITGALSVSGIDPHWLRRAADTMRPGEAALVMAVAHTQDADSLALVAGESGRVIAAAERIPWTTNGEGDDEKTA